MRVAAGLVCFVLTAGLSTASGQLVVQEQFVCGSSPYAGEYVAGAPLDGQSAMGGSIIGFAGAWTAPYEEDDFRGTAYPCVDGLTYQVGPERLMSEGGSFRWIRNRATGADAYSWRGAAANTPRSEWWASVLVRTTEQSHYGAVHLDFGAGTFDFGLSTHGFPYVAGLVGQAEQVMTGQTHLLVACVTDDGDAGETVRLWVDPVLLRATLSGEPPVLPDVEGGPGDDVIVGGAEALVFVNLRTHTFGGYEMFMDEVRVGGSWGDVVPVEVEPGCNGADVAEPLGLLDLNDVTAFVSAFTSGHPVADLSEPVGLLDLSDVTAFIGAFLGGCP